MDQLTTLRCACGQVQLEVRQAPLIVAECHCGSCREAGVRMAALPVARPVTVANGGTPYVLYRKDRVRFVAAGQDRLRAFRLKPGSSTRRVIATCCNTPVFTEFQSGHWLSLYAGLWPPGTAPAPELRTQTGSVPPGTALDDSVPAGGWETAKFYGRLLAAWVAMGFRTPKVEVAGPELEI